MSSGTPTVSVIMPCWNNAAYIATTIDSVLRQTHGDLELLVVDDHSTDGTPDVVRAIDDPRIVLLSTRRQSGPAGARNLGLEKARGTYIAFLDSDDLWARTKLERQLSFMRASNFGFTYTRYKLIDDSGVEFGDSGRLPAVATYESLLSHCFIRTSSAIYAPAMCGGKVMFPPLRKRQDFGMFLALLKNVPQAHLLDEMLCSYRVRKNSVSSNKIANMSYQWAIYRDVEKLDRLSASRYFLRWLFSAGGVNVKRAIAKSMQKAKS